MPLVEPTTPSQNHASPVHLTHTPLDFTPKIISGHAQTCAPLEKLTREQVQPLQTPASIVGRQLVILSKQTCSTHPTVLCTQHPPRCRACQATVSSKKTLLLVFTPIKLIFQTFPQCFKFVKRTWLEGAFLFAKDCRVHFQYQMEIHALLRILDLEHVSCHRIIPKTA